MFEHSPLGFYAAPYEVSVIEFVELKGLLVFVDNLCDLEFKCLPFVNKLDGEFFWDLLSDVLFKALYPFDFLSILGLPFDLHLMPLFLDVQIFWMESGYVDEGIHVA